LGASSSSFAGVTGQFQTYPKPRILKLFLKTKKLNMLKMKNHFSYVLIVCAFFLCGIGKAQENGIKFETGLSWQQVKAKAQAENKLIFMDCYATWCGPCKQMEQEIYPRKEVGDYLNAHFVNVKLQMDKTSSDEQLVRTWYACADSLSKLFHISAYPTYLFFSMDGQPLHETVPRKRQLIL
jgi:thiol:disulfide interchange protein